MGVYFSTFLYVTFGQDEKVLSILIRPIIFLQSFIQRKELKGMEGEEMTQVTSFLILLSDL